MRRTHKAAVFVLFLFGLFLFPGISNAGISIYSGQDDGALVGGPFPSSAAAEVSFTAAAAGFGTLNTITFENQAVGYYTPFTAAPGVTITLTGPIYSYEYSGIPNTTLGNLYGFNTTPSGTKWLGFPGGTATFTFATPTNSFGMYLTGLQTVFTSSLTVTFTDTALHTLTLPVNVLGGAQYFGFTDSLSISSIQISNLSIDAWGIDDITYNSTAPVPEPCTMLLLGSGLAGVAAFRRKFKKA